uniref:Heparan-sulfate 6-O-sulfotransferase n=1 Tax=Strigamia maritima TaxID=126957 RepID=T1IVF7_STRMM
MENCMNGHVRFIILICIIFTLCSLIYFGYFCSDKVCAFTGRASESDYSRILAPLAQQASVGKPLSFAAAKARQPKHDNKQTKFSFEDIETSEKKVVFDIRRSDVIVFLHIQKTGGTSFGRHLVQDLDLEKPCDCRENRKKCKCTRPNSNISYWLFSRYSTGWLCGLHADWTELTNCVDSTLNQREVKQIKRRYFYVTLLRDPIQRFLSEFLHVQRGATWKQARHWCGGKEATTDELPPCFQDETWDDVQLDEFMSCKSNLAINRQTRMLANLDLVGCYNTSLMTPEERDTIMLSSAKENVRKMAFFGLCEHQLINQYLFENIFDMHFLTQFRQFNETHVATLLKSVSTAQVEQIRQLNRLDIELYEYAQTLLLQRFEQMKNSDPHFKNRFRNLGRLKKTEFRWEDIEE